MGLRDILTGMQNGPRGQPQPGSGSRAAACRRSSSRSSDCLRTRRSRVVAATPQAPADRASRPAYLPLHPAMAGGGLADVLGGLFGGKTASAPAGTTSGGNLGDLLKGGLGGLLGGAAAGSVLSGGLGNLLQGFQESGHGHTADSWVGTGPNKAIAPNDLADALGSDTLDTLSQHTGMGRNDLLEALRHQLPGFVDQLTPHGRIPSEDEASRMV